MTLDKKNIDIEKTSLFGTKVKKFKNHDPGLLGYFVKTFVCIAAIESYFIINHVLGN